MNFTKSKFFKLLFVLFIFAIINNTSEAQPTTALDCGEVHPANRTVLRANGFDLLYLNFPDETPNGIFFEDESGQIVSVEEIALSQNAIAYRITDTNSGLSLKRVNSCGEKYNLLSYPLNSELVGDPSTYVSSENQPVAISREMSDALVDYTEGQVPLSQFLLARPDLDIFERAYVYQRSILKKIEPIDIPFAELAADPGIIITVDPPEPLSCNCTKFYVELEVTPADLGWSTADGYKNVYHHVWSFLGENGNETSLANGGSSAKLWNVLGPGGYRGLWSDGWKEDQNHYDERESFAGDGNATLEDIEEPSAYFAEIGLSLICNDGQQLPTACGCDRLVHFDYFYRSQLHTNANTLSGGGGDKESVAAAQDIAAVYVAEQGDIGQNETTTLVNGLDFRVRSECERNVDPEFWTNIFDLTGDIVEIFLLTKGVNSDNPIYDSLYNELSAGDQTDILEALENVITTNYYAASSCSSRTETGDINNTYTTLLTPNKRLRLGILNIHRLVSGGMRSWESHVSRLADFSVSAVIQPGDGGDEPLNEDCCSPWTGVYAYCNQLATDQGEHVAAFFGLYGLPDPIGLIEPKTKGYAGCVTRPADTANCDLEPTVIVRSEKDEQSDQLPVSFRESTIVIYTIDGKFVEKYETTIDADEVEQFVSRQLKNRLASLSNGIYVISILNENGVQSFKYLNQ